MANGTSENVSLQAGQLAPRIVVQTVRAVEASHLLCRQHSRRGRVASLHSWGHSLVTLTWKSQGGLLSKMTRAGPGLVIFEETKLVLL